MKLFMVPLILIEMIILDTAVWIALLNKKDSCHNRAKGIAKNINYSALQIFDHIYIETLTVLRNKTTDLACKKFIKFFQDAKQDIIITNKKFFVLANHFFFRFKKLSFTDCLILAAAKVDKSQLITFDKALQKAWEEIKN